MEIYEPVIVPNVTVGVSMVKVPEGDKVPVAFNDVTAYAKVPSTVSKAASPAK